MAGLRASLHGSLAFTGKGHASDRAVILGLGRILSRPHWMPTRRKRELARIAAERIINDPKLGAVAFDPVKNLIFDYDEVLEGHANGMRFWATDKGGEALFSEVYYSIGGGFVQTAAELEETACPQEGRDVGASKGLELSIPLRESCRDAGHGSRERQDHRRDEIH